MKDCISEKNPSAVKQLKRRECWLTKNEKGKYLRVWISQKFSMRKKEKI